MLTALILVGLGDLADRSCQMTPVVGKQCWHIMVRFTSGHLGSPPVIWGHFRSSGASYIRSYVSYPVSGIVGCQINEIKGQIK